jgi:isopenicillin-N epimerase
LKVEENRFWGSDWPQVRALWSLDPSVAHLNHGSFGAVPIPVQRVQDELRRRVEENPMKNLSRTLFEELDKARVEAAKFLGAEPEGFAFVHNATTGANTILAGPFIQQGDEVLVTDQTYGAVKYTAERVCLSRNAKLVTCSVPLPRGGSEELVDAILSRTSDKTRMAIVDHIASPTGLVFPVKRLVKELHDRGVLVMVDAAHAPGMVNLSIKDLAPDFWTGNFHKWCCSPRGSAGLWVKEEHRKSIKPVITSWFANEDYPSSFRWLGTDDYTPYLAVPAALEFMERLGWNRVRSHNKALSRYGRDVVNGALGAEPIMPGQEEMFEAMTLLRLPSGSVATDEEARLLQARLANVFGVESCPVAWNGKGYLRLSAQVYNAAGEYDRLARGVSQLLVGSEN